MALIKCSECGHMISDKAPMCPHCGCPTRDEETQYPWDAAPSNTRVLNRRKGRSNKWLYVVITLWVAVLAGGGYYWYSHSTGDKDVKELVALFAKAVAAGDRQTISNLYPDAATADSLNFSYDEKSLQVIENNENEWKVTGFGDKELIIAKNEADKTLYIKESHGVFAYPDTLFTMAKGTGWYDKNLNDKQNAERLSDKDFISWMNKKALKELKNKVKITKATSTKGPGYTPEDIPATSGDTNCTVIVTNNIDFDLSGNEYKIQAQEKWNYWTNWETPDMNGLKYPCEGKVKYLSGKPIPANGSVTFSWKGNGYCEMAHSGDIDFKLTASITFTPQFEKSVMKAYHFTGKEYEEYIAEKGK